MIFDFSKKEDVISFGSISSPLLKKISRKCIKNINTSETIVYTDNVEDLKYFLTKDLDLNIPFCNLQENKYMKSHISENIKDLDKLKFLHEHGFDFKSDITERHEEKIKMLSLYQDVIKEQRQVLNSSINVKPIDTVIKARL